MEHITFLPIGVHGRTPIPRGQALPLEDGNVADRANATPSGLEVTLSS